MKKLFVTLMAAALMLTFGAGAASAQTGTGTVAGKAVRWNGDAISGATIRVLAGPLETDKELSRTTTAADGSYAVSLPAGQPYWVHIDTLGSWWGYSYQTPFTVRPGETISQVFFALGPRDVKEIALPSPVSNVAPATGTNEAPAAPAPPVQAPVVAPPVAAPAAPAVTKPVSNVKPALGYNDTAAKPAPAPRTLPRTGASNFETILFALTGALALAVAGLGMRRAALTSR